MEVAIVLITIVIMAAGSVVYYSWEWFGAAGLVALIVLSIALYALYLRRCYRNAAGR